MGEVLEELPLGLEVQFGSELVPDTGQVCPALLQAVGVNLLVLDEPTNHLDLPAIEQLESALESFDGTLVLVTHDRRMLESVRHTRRLVVDAGRVSER